MLLRLHQDGITGRRWVSLGSWLHLGFGPHRFLERIHWKDHQIWHNRAAAHQHRVEALQYEAEKERRQAQYFRAKLDESEKGT